MNGSIVAQDVAKSFGQQPILRGVSFEVTEGIFALLGRNGAGKTTLISIMTSLIRADSGTVHVAGFDVVRERMPMLHAIATTGQFAAIDNALTGRENLELFARLRGFNGKDARTRATELLGRFSLEKAGSKIASTYSGGMRRRLDLAASLITQPRVLFLDEPTTGLDPISRRQLWDDVKDLAAHGTTVLLTTQYLEEADALADRIAILRDGAIVAEGTAKELTSLVGNERLIALSPSGKVLQEIATDGTAEGIRKAIDQLTAADSRLENSQIELRRPTLDDAFDILTAEATMSTQEVSA